jgi:hypothetical protein
MDRPRSVVEPRLRRATSSFRLLRAGELAAVWTGAFAVAALGLGILMWRDRVTHPVVVGVSLLAILLAAGLAFVVLAAFAATASRPRFWLAHRLERVHPGLLDRLNTLVFLEPERYAATVRPFFRKIEDQASEVLAAEPFRSPYSRRPLLWRWLAAAALVATTVAFYARYDPLAHVRYPEEAAVEPPPDSPVEEAAARPDADAVEAEEPWGEVRITEPGHDVRVTKVDVVPLSIEAASNRPLQQALWVSNPPDGARRNHALPAPSEPHYAAYQATLSLDEYRLSDWDVLSYFATATTKGGPSYASDIYFVEVRPFREDLLKLPGGEGGKAYAMLNELSGLVDAQKHVMRETHGHLQRRYEKAELAAQDRTKLADAERGLAEASRHLYAKMAAELENAPIGDVLDNLAKAEGTLDRAGRAVAGQQKDALAREQDALTDLVATRKTLQKTITDNPEAFGDGDQADAAREPPTADQLKKIAEFRHEAKAVAGSLRELAERQKKVAEAARGRGDAPEPELAAQQESVASELAQLKDDHPRAFKGSEPQAEAARQAAEESAEALRRGQDAPRQAAEAQQAMDALRDRASGAAGARGLSQAYRLREMIEDQARAMGGLPQGEGAGEAAGRLAEDARETTRELGRTIEETPAGEAFGPGLRKALSPQEQQARERALDALARAEGADERRKAAGQSKVALDQLARAFDDSAPASSREARSADALGGGEGTGDLGEALRRLQQLVLRPEAGDAEADRKRRQEARASLRGVLERQYGQEKRTPDLLVETDAALQGGQPIDAARIRKLVDAIERFRVELTDARLTADQDPRLRHADVDRLPAAYRDRIQRYFQRLSEK